MSEAKSLLRDLDAAISQGTAQSRERALWYATDLLITGGYREEEVDTFGEVIGRLSEEIEIASRAQLAGRLAQFEGAPDNVIRKLAFDDSIDVAGPVLSHSERLDSDTLVANAESKGQSHLLAISKRKSLDAVVTDVLVVRGDQEVVSSVVRNQGARFSGFGFLHMVKRAEGDSILAEQLGLRTDIPRQLFQQLIAKASEDVKQRLGRERPELVAQIQSSVSEVAGALQSKLGPASRSHFVAKRVVATQHRLGNLNETSIAGYARAHRFEEVTIGLSLLSSIPGDVVERVLVDRNREMLLVLAKAHDFSWDTTMSLLFLGAKDHRISARDLGDLKHEYDGLNAESSRSIVKFYETRTSSMRIPA